MKLLALAALALAVAGAAVAAEDPPVVVTRETAATAPGCGPREAAAAARTFADAVGDSAALERVLAIPLERFAVIDRSGDFRADTRAEAIEWLARSAPIALLAVEVGPGDPARIALGAIFERGSTRYDTKLVVDCRSRVVHAAVLNARAARSFLCRGLRDGAVVACANGPNAHAFSPDFVVNTANGVFGRGCSPGDVRNRLKAMLAAFNRGDGASFAAGLTRNAKVFADRIPVLPRAGLVRWVRGEFAAGVGWTATRLSSGTSRGSRAAYGLGLEVTRGGKPLGRAGVKIVVGCGSGRIEHWGGGRVEP